MISGTRIIYLRRINIDFLLKFSKGYLDRQTHVEGQRGKRPKHCNNSNKYENNCSQINNVNNMTELKKIMETIRK